jgi:hypothetical protein
MEVKVGKAADNERLKLKAIFYNNLAAGIILASAIIPALAISARIDDITTWLSDVWLNDAVKISESEIKRFVGALVAFASAIGLGLAFRLDADKLLRRIED